MSQNSTDENAIAILKEIRDLLQSIESKLDDGIDVQVQNSIEVLIHDSIGQTILADSGRLWVVT